MTMRIKPLVWEEDGKFSLLGRGFGGYTTSISFREDGRFKIDLHGIGVLRPTLAMAKELLEDEYQEYMAPAFDTTPTAQLSVALQVPEVAALVEAAKPFAQVRIKNGVSQAGDIGRTDVTNLRAALAAVKGGDA